MKAVFEMAKVIVDGEDAYLCLSVPYQTAKKFLGEMVPSKKYDIEINIHREKRSLNSNAYLWTLLDKLADALETTKEELYLDYVQKYGVFRDFILTEDEAKTLRHAWEMLGTGWPTQQIDYDADGERMVIRAYYGTSQYNTKQMSRILNAVVEDCKGQGIETMTPQELARLTEEWGRQSNEQTH